jgi:hypothetical protein
MALQKTITIDFNGASVDFSDAYLKVGMIEGDKNMVRFVLHVHKAEDDRVVDRRTYHFAPDMNGNNFVAQAYQHLKTLSEYSNATDV